MLKHVKLVLLILPVFALSACGDSSTNKETTTIKQSQPDSFLPSEDIVELIRIAKDVDKDSSSISCKSDLLGEDPVFQDVLEDCKLSVANGKKLNKVWECVNRDNVSQKCLETLQSLNGELKTQTQYTENYMKGRNVNRDSACGVALRGGDDSIRLNDQLMNILPMLESTLAMKQTAEAEGHLSEFKDLVLSEQAKTRPKLAYEQMLAPCNQK